MKSRRSTSAPKRPGRPPNAEPEVAVELTIKQPEALHQLIDDLAELAVDLWREGKLDLG